MWAKTMRKGRGLKIVDAALQRFLVVNARRQTLLSTLLLVSREPTIKDALHHHVRVLLVDIWRLLALVQITSKGYGPFAKLSAGPCRPHAPSRSSWRSKVAKSSKDFRTICQGNQRSDRKSSKK